MARWLVGIWYACVGSMLVMMVVMALVTAGYWPGVGGGFLWPATITHVRARS